MKSSFVTVVLGALLALSTGCNDVFQPESPATVAEVRVHRVGNSKSWVEAGDVIQLSAGALDAHGNLIPQQTFVWQSSDEAIATVREGRVTAKARGEVTISAMTSGKTGAMILSIYRPGESPPDNWDNW